MSQRIHFITVATKDLDAGRRFYQDGLGWEPLMDVPDEIIFFQVAPGLVLGLFQADKFVQDLGGAVLGTDVSGLMLSHNVESPERVRATVEKMVAAGGTVLKQPTQSDFGGIFHSHVQDPNGVIWEIAHNPGWHLEPDGTVVFE
ncbi:VOC family protein [Georgenia ruanii]|uniref:VOC family protein n=1 Tax=Georgenia ruanii TaxID=348442 RepID=A0A7J9UY55_9MICO|nr:VOC family protein [Georgenia ruanii]MPV89567.1 VOC family protein [Georgenia ruanii]